MASRGPTLFHLRKPGPLRLSSKLIQLVCTNLNWNGYGLELERLQAILIH